MATHQPKSVTGRTQQDKSIGATLLRILRILGGLSTEELSNPEKAAHSIDRTVRIVAAYSVVAAFAIFFLSIPSFIRPDGSLHIENFTAFFQLGNRFVDCLALLALSLFLARSKKLPIAISLVGLAGFESYFYTQHFTMLDFVMLLMSLMVLIHALQILGLLIFGHKNTT